MAPPQLFAGGFAEPSVADDERDYVARAGHHPQAGFGRPTFQGCRTLLMALAFDLTRL